MRSEPGKKQDFQDILEIQQYMTVTQAAKKLQVSEDYIRKLINNEHLQSIKLPGGRRGPVRIPVEALKEIITRKAAKKSQLHRPEVKQNSRRVYHGVFSE